MPAIDRCTVRNGQTILSGASADSRSAGPNDRVACRVIDAEAPSCEHVQSDDRVDARRLQVREVANACGHVAWLERSNPQP